MQMTVTAVVILAVCAGTLLVWRGSAGDGPTVIGWAFYGAAAGAALQTVAAIAGTLWMKITPHSG
jgi:hypothetical protein